MNALQWLSALNWVFALLYSLPFIVTLALGLPGELVLGALLLGLLVAAPHVYLALNIEKGRGRLVQSAYAVLSLCNFPFGTAFGVFALMTVWSEEHRDLFENPAEASSEAGGPPRAPRDFSAAADALEFEEAELPRAFALRLRRAGASNAQLRDRLREIGLDREEVEMVLRSLAAPARTPAPRRP